jgi:hypothetical protein
MTKPDLPKYLKLCRMGTSLYLTIPKEFVRAHTLNQRDDVLWQPTSNGIVLQFDPAKVRAPEGDAA